MRKLLTPYQRYYLAKKQSGYAHIAFAYEVKDREYTLPKIEKALLKEERFLETTDVTPNKVIELDLTNSNADDELRKLRASFSTRRLYPEKGMSAGFEVCALSQRRTSVEVDFDLAAVSPDFLRTCLNQKTAEKVYDAPEKEDILYWYGLRDTPARKYDLKGEFASVSFSLGNARGEDLYERLLTAYLMNYTAVISGIEEPIIILSQTDSFPKSMDKVKKAYAEGMRHNSFSNWKAAELIGGKFPMFCNFLDCELSYLHITIPNVPYIFAFYMSGGEVTVNITYDISFSKNEISLIYEKFRETLEDTYA